VRIKKWSQLSWRSCDICFCDCTFVVTTVSPLLIFKVFTEGCLSLWSAGMRLIVFVRAVIMEGEPCTATRLHIMFDTAKAAHFSPPLPVPARLDQ